MTKRKKSKKKASAAPAAPAMQDWEISRNLARDGMSWLIQCRTKDQFSSFAVVARKDGTNISRGKSATGDCDTFTITTGSLAEPTVGVTMNVCGKISYSGDWENV